MSILLIIYILFLIAYMAFNAYVIFRINTMRVKNDLTNRGIIIYVIAIAAILVISFVIIGTLDWSSSLMGGRFGI